jgi:DNA-binding GntR family transcriptional regulator
MTDAKKSKGLKPVRKLLPKPRSVSPTQSSPHRVYSGVMTGLYEGRFAPGQRLVEADLSQMYGVSRNSVREALHRLAAERIVSLNLHRGAQIRLLSRNEAQNILELLELLIGLSAKLAAQRIQHKNSQKLFAGVLNNLLSFEKRPDSIDLLKARNAFYRTLVDIGGNNELGRVLPSMHVHLLRVQFRSFRPGTQQESFADYERIGEAVLEGNPRRAELAAQAHVRRIAKVLDQLPDDAFAHSDEDGSPEWGRSRLEAV